MLTHLITRKPKVVMLGTYIDKYDDAYPDYRERLGIFAQGIADDLSADVSVDILGIGSCSDEVVSVVRRAEAAAVDAIVILSLGYTNSLIASKALVDTSIPLVFFNTQETDEVSHEFGFDDLLTNHGMQGVQDVACVLARHNRKFGIVTGLISQADTRASLVDHLIAARAYRQLRASRIAAMGPMMTGMGDAEFNTDAFKSVFGVKSLELSFQQLVEATKEIDEEEIESARAFDREHFEIADDLTREDHDRSLRLEIGLRKLIEEHTLAGLTFSFDHIAAAPGIETIPFHGMTKLMGDGIAYGGEGDLFTTAAGVIARSLGGDFTFTELYTMDFQNNCVLNTHMAELNWRMARKDRRPRLLRRQFSLAECKPFCSLFFGLEPGPVTLAGHTQNITGRFKLITFEAEVADFPLLEDFERPNFKLKFKRDLREIMNDYSLAGGPHHLNMFYGHHARRYRRLCDLLDCDYIHIPND